MNEDILKDSIDANAADYLQLSRALRASLAPAAVAEAEAWGALLKPVLFGIGDALVEQRIKHIRTAMDRLDTTAPIAASIIFELTAGVIQTSSSVAKELKA